MKIFSLADLNVLTDQAVNSSRHRQHLNLHTSFEEPCQRLLNAIEPNSYIRPHKHSSDQGVETIFALRGLMALVSFDDAGSILNVTRFGTSCIAAELNVPLGCEISPGMWHTVISLESYSVLLELKGGPFNPKSPKFPALWAPEEGSPASKTYIDDLKKLVVDWFSAM